ncbi:MAG TPA: sigma-70 family RNA polymerase sigma factor [Pseudonocardiaceae bacterium]|nr:sigma-70 family RNA polymerase sigma factor [Pseudonocardiaceae bacterium]
MTVLGVAGSQGCLLTRDYPLADATASVAELLTLISQRDSTAWEEIVRRYGSIVFATVRSFRLQDADVLDAVQMTWLRLAENAHRVQYPERLAGWLATTARREALRIQRQHSKHTLIPAEAVTENVADPAAGPEQRVIHHETQRILRDVIAELSPLRRSLLRTLFIDNPQRYTEVAHTVGIPLGGIGPTRARALQQLRRRLDELGLGPETTPQQTLLPRCRARHRVLSDHT